MKKRHVLGLSILVMVSLLLAGCRTGPTAEEIVAHVQEMEANTEDAHAVIEFNAQIEGRDLQGVVELWEKKPNQFRVEVLEASQGDFAGVVSVTDGQQVWLYHPGQNTVVTGGLGDLHVEEMALDPQQAFQVLQDGIQWVMDNFDVKLVGEEQVAGAAAYKLAFTPREDEEYPMPIPMDAQATLWVEKERWIVLQAQLDGGVMGQGTVRVRSFEFNTGLSDDRFRFDIPAGAEVIEVQDMAHKSTTLDEAKAAADFPLLVPAYVPEGVTLVGVLEIGQAIALRYDHSTTTFTIVQGELPDGMEETPSGETRQIDLRGQTATLITDQQGNSFLSWTEAGVDIAIAGHISADEVVKVAESLE